MEKNYFEPNLINNKINNCRVKKCGNIVELMQCSSGFSSTAPITKIDKDNFVINSTGEVRQFKHKDNRADNKESVRQSLARLRDYINTNVVNVDCWKWITLTYAENMQDTKTLYKDFDKFIKKIKYNYSVYNIEYIVAMEPQGRGAWHCHLLLGFGAKAPFVPNDTISKLWGHGFTTTKDLDKSITNIGAYLTAYLGDMELDNTISNSSSVVKEITTANGYKKKIVKGARLALYPNGFNLYRCSRGIKKPTIVRSYPWSNLVKNIVEKYQMTYSKGVQITIVDLEKEKLIEIEYTYFYFNLAHKKTEYLRDTPLAC